MKLILAKNRDRFRDWCKENNVDYKYPSSLSMYVDNMDKIRGVIVDEVVLYRDWWESDLIKNSSVNEVLAGLTTRVRTRPELAKPPIGIVPEWLWKERRARELVETISRFDIAHVYDRADTTVAKWCQELYELSLWLQEYREKK